MKCPELPITGQKRPMRKFEAISVQVLSKLPQNLHIYIVARTRRQSGQKDTSMFSFPIGSENIGYVVRPSEFIDSITPLIVENNFLSYLAVGM
jgi:hypothetical protein